MRRLGRTGIEVAELCLGAMTFGREIGDAESRSLLDRYLDAGGNFVDTADVYAGGVSEEIVGRALVGRRDRVVLATKVRMPLSADPNDGGASRRHIRAGIEASLRRLQTEWIDLYQIHCWDDRTPLEETLSTLDDLVREGKVRYVGASNYAAWQLAKVLGLAALHRWEPFVSLQPQYSLVVRDIERELLPLCLAEGLAVLPWSPLGGGILTGKYRADEEPPAGTRGGDATGSASQMRQRLGDEHMFRVVATVMNVAAECGHTPAQVALNWVTNRPGVTSTILGARTLEQLDDNLGALGWELSEEHLAALDEASRIERGYPYEFIDWVNSL